MCNLNIEKAELTKKQIEFIQIFTRMEFALKECGYIKRDKEHAEVDWNKFSNEVLQKKFFKKEQKLSSIICKKPPMRQIIRSKALDWEAVDPPNCIQDLIGAVQRVRNNLLHGGKHGELDPKRNNDLVSNSVELLKRAVVMDACIKSAFEGL
jgi:hypothetical protein